MTTTKSGVRAASALAERLAGGPDGGPRPEPGAHEVGTRRTIVIERVEPELDGGRHPVKRVVGDELTVTADIFADGHDLLAAALLVRADDDPAGTWSETPMRLVDNDRWSGRATVTRNLRHRYTIEAWRDAWGSWHEAVEKKVAAGVAVPTELAEGRVLLQATRARAGAAGDAAVVSAIDAALAALDRGATEEAQLAALTDAALLAHMRRHPDRTTATRYRRELELVVDRERARHGAWYELFPRSQGRDPEAPTATTFRDAIWRLDDIAAMGFDVVYLPPIHPIGTAHRKGRNNTLVAEPDDPGSPYAIGSADGGHRDVAPELGGLEAFEAFRAAVEERGMELAIDLAIQASPDHPYVASHPEWFRHAPDGTIKYAENPPKKYQDLHPIDFWPAEESDRVALWEAARDIVLGWVGHGITIFRVDNPHTKPLAFWAWLIEDLHEQHPELVFLAEAFTTPEMMAKLAEVGFTQSYTYFTWRTEAWELRDYVVELSQGPLADHMRPAFWPNTPDILAGPLRRGPRSAFALRLVLAATLVPTYGIYSGYELCENQPASESNEEYDRSEKYELKDRDYTAFDSLAPLVRRVNEIRRGHPTLWDLRDVRFHHSDDDHFLVYSRGHAATDLLLCVVNLDPLHAHETTIRLDLGALGLPAQGGYEVLDELTGESYTWGGDAAYVRLDPDAGQVAHLFRVTR